MDIELLLRLLDFGGTLFLAVSFLYFGSYFQMKMLDMIGKCCDEDDE